MALPLPRPPRPHPHALLFRPPHLPALDARQRWHLGAGMNGAAALPQIDSRPGNRPKGVHRNMEMSKNGKSCGLDGLGVAHNAYALFIRRLSIWLVFWATSKLVPA